MSFDDLTNEDKVKVIRNNGDFLASIAGPDSCNQLFYFSKMFVEIKINTSAGLAIEARVLNSNELERYLNEIQLLL